MVTTIPVISQWIENWYQVYGIDLILSLILSGLTAGFVTILFFRLFREDRLAGTAGALMTMFLIGGDFEDRLKGITPVFNAINPLPDLGAWQIAFYTLIFLVLVFFIARYVGILLSRICTKRNAPVKEVLGGVTVAIGVIFLIQLTPAIRDFVLAWPQYTYIPPALPGNPTATASRPDIYYIVLDRYTSQDILQTQFGFDNTPFTSFLTANGFSINPNAHQNYPYTTMSVSSTLNANYQTDIVQKFGSSSVQTIDSYHQAIRNSSVATQLKSLGYAFDELGTWYEASNTSDVADSMYQPEGLLTILGHTTTLNTFTRNQVETNVFWGLISKGFHIGSHTLLGYSSIDEADATLSKLQLLSQIANQPQGGKFVFAHILVPHDPYYFNADGSFNTNAESDNIGEPIKQKYTAQVQFINTQMEDLVTEINKNSDGKAVIIIQSDEGPYPAVLNDQNFDGGAVDTELAEGSMLSWSDADLQMKYGILAAYHIPNATPEALAAGGDSVNIFRVVLNTYFNDNLPYLPRCYYAYANGRSQAEIYSDITQRLTGTANSSCPPDSNFK